MAPIDVETDNRGVATVTINNPEQKNAATLEMFVAIGDAFRELAIDSSVRTIVLTGTGTEFCSGASLGGEGHASEHKGLTRMRLIHRTPAAIVAAPQPVIARIDGVAVGAGLSMALACDMLIATDRSRFSAIFAKRGLNVDCGMSWLLPRAIGLARAKELVLTAGIIDAQRALDIGLVNDVVAGDAFDERVDNLVADLAAGPPLALSMSKALLNNGVNSSLDAALEAEGVAQNVNFGSEDGAEAIRAFVAKRAPEFKGR